ncbi:hypothetical protein AGDE_14064 [Angomonas deanei]|uniref:Uncharacterized protein n=1 Tax=Angomonas deanei TaxID=59799 RepID=A0A7G2CL23_9TRYP|nr:hypothetical protein AGDE_14064 [Angomonas deanei]CAD2219757.1 hypothetical protein, conserved [Angomonas deanei]|eukprot:EPY21489.1 hypothetical protein AGDE_14064 [Angomonas deanei]
MSLLGSVVTNYTDKDYVYCIFIFCQPPVGCVHRLPFPISSSVSPVQNNNIHDNSTFRKRQGTIEIERGPGFILFYFYGQYYCYHPPFMSGSHHLYTETGRALPPPPRRTPKRSSSVVRLPTRRYDPILDDVKGKPNCDNPLVADSYNNCIPVSERRNSRVAVYDADEAREREGKARVSSRRSSKADSTAKGSSSRSKRTPSARTPRGSTFDDEESSDSPILNRKYGGDEDSDYMEQFQSAYSQRRSEGRQTSSTKGKQDCQSHSVEEIQLSREATSTVGSEKPTQRLAKQQNRAPPKDTGDRYYSIGGSELNFPSAGAGRDTPNSRQSWNPPSEGRLSNTRQSSAPQKADHDRDNSMGQTTNAYDSAPKQAILRPQPIRPSADAREPQTRPLEQSTRSAASERLRVLRQEEKPVLDVARRDEAQSLSEMARSPRPNRRPPPAESSYQPQLSPVKHHSTEREPPSPRYSQAREPVDEEPIIEKARRYSASPLRTGDQVAGTELLPRRPLLQGMHYDDDRHYRTILRFIDNQPKRQRPELMEMLAEFEGREDELCDALADAYGDEFEVMKYYPANQVQEVEVAQQRLLLMDGSEGNSPSCNPHRALHGEDSGYENQLLTPPVPTRL